MKNIKWIRWISVCLVAALLIGSVAAALGFDLSGDGKTDVWDLQLGVNNGVSAEDQKAALNEALGGGDELHKNDEGHWEIWTSLGLYNMAKNAEAGDTFVLMRDIDMEGKQWTPVKNFNGKLIGDMHTISNMKINQDVDGNMGFFGNIAEGGYVEYLNVSDMNFIASARSVNIGLLAGTCAGTIDGCTAIGFITDARTELPGNVYVGGLAGKMLSGGSIISRDTNKLPEVGAEQAINTISAQIGTRFAVEPGHIVGIVGDGMEAVDTGTVLQNLTGTMPDPNAIAWVQNGDSWVFPLNLTELTSAIASDGNSVVTLQEDISHTTSAISIPYSCTIDCNGHTIATNPEKNNCINVSAVGTENKTFTIKNGVIKHYEIGVRVSAGAVVVSDMVIISNGGAPVGLYDATDYSAINRIENSVLVSKNWGCVVFNGKNLDMSSTGITIENSDLISGKAAGFAVLIKNQASHGGTVTLGDNVNLYSYADTYSQASVTVAGVDPVKLEDKETVTVEDLTYEGLTRWTTDEEIINKEVIAEVTNGSETIQVTNTTDMIAAISSAGTTQIKLLKDLDRSSSLAIPYSCTIDLNGHTITSTFNCFTLQGVGTANTVTTIKNGTLNHSVIGVRINAGSVNLSNVNINGVGNCGSSVGFYDPSAAYKSGNKIEGCTIYNPNYFDIMFYGTDVEFKDTGVAIENTTLIAAKNYPFGVTTQKMSGIVDLGKGVEIYSSKTAVAGGSLYRFLGLVAYRTDKTSVTVNGTEITGMCHWSTDNQKDIVDILLIGNSYSTTIPQELYNIATNAGYEVNVANLYFPGCIAAEHWDWLNNDVANYQYRHQSEMGSYIRRGDMSTSKYALEDEEWDVIIYQDWFTPKNVVRDSGYVCDASTLESLYANHQEPAYNMMQYLKKNYPNAKHYYYQHWSWQVGHSSIPDIATANAMWDRINTASTKFAEENDFILIPCGLAFQLARADESIGETLWDTDKSHDGAAGGGQYLNGCVFFETIFQESCIGDNWRASNGPSEEKHVLLQQYAHEAVATVHGEDWAK